MRHAFTPHAAEEVQCITLNPGVVFSRCAHALAACGDSIERAPCWRTPVLEGAPLPTSVFRPGQPCALTLYRSPSASRASRMLLRPDQHAAVSASFRAFADSGLEIAEGVIPKCSGSQRGLLLEETFDWLAHHQASLLVAYDLHDRPLHTLS